MTYTTPAQRAAALSAHIHAERLAVHLDPPCDECQTISGLLTGLVRMARELHTKAEYIEALIAEAAETLDLIDDSDIGLGPVDVGPQPDPPTTATMADHTTTTRVSLLGTAR